MKRHPKTIYTITQPKGEPHLRVHCTFRWTTAHTDDQCDRKSVLCAECLTTLFFAKRSLIKFLIIFNGKLHILIPALSFQKEYLTLLHNEFILI